MENEITFTARGNTYDAGIVEDAISWFLLFTGNGTKR